VQQRRRRLAALMIAGRVADFVLFVVTVVELGFLLVLVPRFTATDWIYVGQHVLVLGIALTRHPPRAQDRSPASTVALVVSYAYPYAQVALLRWGTGYVVWPTVGLYLVTVAAGLSLASLLTLGRGFGLRPALRRLATTGPYRLVRHPIYLAYVLADVGYNLTEWARGSVLVMLVGWASLVYRIQAEERILSQDAAWTDYRASTRYRLIPGLW
jgi:protein-S-isoprenylcysteine O-methyltransferase Ste14